MKKISSLSLSFILHLFPFQPAVSPLYSCFFLSFYHYLSIPHPLLSSSHTTTTSLSFSPSPFNITHALSLSLILHHLPSLSLFFSLPSIPFSFFSLKKRSDWERHSVRIAGSRWRLSAPADSLCRSDLSPLH